MIQIIYVCSIFQNTFRRLWTRLKVTKIQKGFFSKKCAKELVLKTKVVLVFSVSIFLPTKFLKEGIGLRKKYLLCVICL